MLTFGGMRPKVEIHPSLYILSIPLSTCTSTLPTVLTTKRHRLLLSGVLLIAMPFANILFSRTFFLHEPEQSADNWSEHFFMGSTVFQTGAIHTEVCIGIILLLFVDCILSNFHFQQSKSVPIMTADGSCYKLYTCKRKHFTFL